MKYVAVTTCNAAGWDQYGRRMVESFAKFWPSSISLIVYAEGFLAHDHDNIHFDYVNRIGFLRDFKDRHIDNPVASGNRYTPSYRFQNDAIRFSNKIAAYIEEHEALGADETLIWIDADTVTHAPVTIEWLDSLVKGPFDIAWLDRTRQYPECGFIMFRKTEPTKAIMAELARLIREDDIFNLPEQHDSYVLDKVVDKYRSTHPIAIASLSGRFKHYSHPFVAGPLGERMDHLKGIKRKEVGHSLKQDVSEERIEAYWRNSPDVKNTPKA